MRLNSRGWEQKLGNQAAFTHLYVCALFISLFTLLSVLYHKVLTQYLMCQK